MNVFRRVILTAAMSTLAACGGTSTSPPSGTPTPVEVTSGTMAISAGDFVVAPFTLDARAALQLRIDWSAMANDLDGYLLRGACSRDDVLSAKPACTMDTALVGAGTGTAKPEVFTTAALDAGPFTLLIVNRGGSNDTCTYRITKAS